MAIFVVIESEPLVQVGDKTRIDASRTFVSPDEEAVTLIEIKPSTSDDYIEVTDLGYLDWVYDEEGDQEFSVRVTTDGSPVVKSGTIEVLSEEDDRLFSNDSDLKTHEHDILRWLPAGRSSYKNVHRRAQTLILAYLDKEGKVDVHGNKFTKEAFVNIEEGKEWATFLVLKLIFQGLSNATDDIFAEKAKEYAGQEVFYRDRVILRIDVDGDGVVDEGEEIEGMGFARVVRR